MSKKIGLVIFLVSYLCVDSFSQYATHTLSKKQQEYTDSLKRIDYDHFFPILGKKAYKMGFDIPYPVGIMANYFYTKQGLVIENLQLGLTSDNNEIPLTPVDIVEFGSNSVAANSYNVRPDIWIFPFLSVYGVFVVGNSTTIVNLVAPVALRSEVKQGLKTAGVGLTGAFGLGPLFTAVDINWTWNKPEKLEKPVPANVLSIRLGHSIKFPQKPQRNIALWVGAMRARIGAGTVGQIALSDALPADVWAKKDQIVSDYYAWYNALDPNNPGDRIKIDKADQILTPIIERIDAADGSATVKYALDKRPTEEWNMIVGGQYQMSKRWIFRTEGGFLGDRKSLLLSVNYRFLAF